jgi:hypothetical protein
MHKTLMDAKDALSRIVMSGRCHVLSASEIVRITGDGPKRKTKAKDCRGIGSLFVVILNLV